MAGRRPVDPVVKISKSLSWLLRHGAEKEGFTFLPGGFLYVDDILKHKKFQSTSLEEIRHIVDTNEKKRFTMETDEETKRLKIRANQGHSLQVEDLELRPIVDASEFPIVVHGTFHKAYSLIAHQGLKRMNRNHVHFAPGEPGGDAVISGMRSSHTVVIHINLKKALEDGLEFFLSSNNVILCPGNEDGVILPSYFDKVMDRKKNIELPFGSNIGATSEVTTISPAAVSAEELADEMESTKKNKRKKGRNRTENMN